MTEIKALASPPQVINDVCSIAYFLYPKTPVSVDWSLIKLHLLGDMSLLNNLQKYDVSHTKSESAARAKKKLASLVKELNVGDGPEFNALVTSKNKATGNMLKWA